MEDVSSATELHKVTVNLVPKAWDAANQTATRLVLSRTDVINRALQVYAYLVEETESGSEVLIRKDDEVTKVRFQ